MGLGNPASSPRERDTSEVSGPIVVTAERGHGHEAPSRSERLGDTHRHGVPGGPRGRGRLGGRRRPPTRVRGAARLLCSRATPWARGPGGLRAGGVAPHRSRLCDRLSVRRSRLTAPATAEGRELSAWPGTHAGRHSAVCVLPRLKRGGRAAASGGGRALAAPPSRRKPPGAPVTGRGHTQGRPLLTGYRRGPATDDGGHEGRQKQTQGLTVSGLRDDGGGR